MTLNEYRLANGLTHMQLAERLDCFIAVAKLLCSGSATPDAALADKIEKVTHGKVRYDLT